MLTDLPTLQVKYTAKFFKEQTFQKIYLAGIQVYNGSGSAWLILPTEILTWWINWQRNNERKARKNVKWEQLRLEATMVEGTGICGAGAAPAAIAAWGPLPSGKPQVQWAPPRTPLPESYSHCGCLWGH